MLSSDFCFRSSVVGIAGIDAADGTAAPPGRRGSSPGVAQERVRGNRTRETVHDFRKKG